MSEYRFEAEKKNINAEDFLNALADEECVVVDLQDCVDGIMGSLEFAGAGDGYDGKAVLFGELNGLEIKPLAGIAIQVDKADSGLELRAQGRSLFVVGRHGDAMSSCRYRLHQGRGAFLIGDHQESWRIVIGLSEFL